MLLRKLLLTTLALTLTAVSASAQPGFLLKWGSHGSGPGQFDIPWGVTVDPNSGEVFVVDQNNNRVQVFDANGQFLRQFGTFGSGAGQFNLPFGIAIDTGGDLFVTEMGNHRVQKVSNAGTPLAMWGSVGNGNGQFNTPTGILVGSDGNVFVCDGLNHRIQKFDASGGFITKWGSFGSGNGSFRIPMGIAEDSQGDLYVADQGNHRVQKFSLGGAFEMAFGSRGTNNDQFAFPQGIAIDSKDHVYVADMGNHRMKEYDTLGNWVVSWGVQGTGDGEFNFPVGVAVDANDNLYVAEYDNSRVQEFGTPPSSPQTETVAAFVDVIPATYPNIIQPENNSRVQVALLSGQNFDVSQVRSLSVKLNGRSPSRYAIGDVGSFYLQSDGCHASTLGADGMDDLIFEFSANDILSALPTWQDGQTEMVTLTGRLADGRTFSATDCVALRYVQAEVGGGGQIAEFFSVRPGVSRANTRVQFAVSEPQRVQMSVFDIGGRRVETLMNEWTTPGTHTIDWNSGHLPSGVYFVRMTTGEQTVVRSVALRN
jgi:DNA-binding beta-propeller fold protein YncE